SQRSESRHSASACGWASNAARQASASSQALAKARMPSLRPARQSALAPVPALRSLRWTYPLSTSASAGRSCCIASSRSASADGGSSFQLIATSARYASTGRPTTAPTTPASTRIALPAVTAVPPSRIHPSRPSSPRSGSMISAAPATRPPPSGPRPPAPLRELPAGLAAESRQVIGLAAGHDALVGHHFLVDHFGAGVAQVGADARPGGHAPPAHHIGLDHHPGAVADDADRLAAAGEVAHEGHRLLVHAQ